jgi:hypothetical protein
MHVNRAAELENLALHHVFLCTLCTHMCGGTCVGSYIHAMSFSLPYVRICVDDLMHAYVWMQMCRILHTSTDTNIFRRHIFAITHTQNNIVFHASCTHTHTYGSEHAECTRALYLTSHIHT